MTFGNSVFINCPFDDEFKPLLNPLLFCILQLGLEPLVSQTDSSADERVGEHEMPFVGYHTSVALFSAAKFLALKKKNN